MKRFLPIILALLLIISGCAGEGSNGDTDNTSGDAVTEPVASTDTETENISESLPAETDPPVSVERKLTDIGGGLWEVDDLPGADDTFISHAFNGTLMLMLRSGDNGGTLTLYDAAANMTVAQIPVEIDDSYMLCGFYGSGIYLLSMGTNRVRLYDGTLTATGDFTPESPDESLPGISFGISYDGIICTVDERIFTVNPADGSLTEYNISDQLPVGTSFVYTSGSLGDRILLEAYAPSGSTLCVWSPADSSLEQITENCRSIISSGEKMLILRQNDTRAEIFDLNNPMTVSVIPFCTSDENPISFDGERFFTVNYKDIATVHEYSVEGELLDCFDLPEGFTLYGVADAGADGTILLCFGDGDITRTLLRRERDSGDDSRSEFSSLKPPAGVLYRSYTKAIKDRYGINVYLVANEKLTFSSYNIEPYTGSFEYALEELTAQLEKFPDNFFNEMLQLGEGYTEDELLDGLDFYLCGGIYGNDGVAIDSAGALTTVQGGRQAIAFSLTNGNSMARDLAHELSHAAERRINSMAFTDELDYLGGFDLLTVETINYYYSYRDPYGNEYGNLYSDYTPDDKLHAGEELFIDSYSRTFPGEDRARIFEYLFSSGTDLPPAFDSPSIREKARMYCAILRACYPSIASSDTLCWERGLGEIPGIETFDIPPIVPLG